MKRISLELSPSSDDRPNVDASSAETAKADGSSPASREDATDWVRLTGEAAIIALIRPFVQEYINNKAITFVLSIALLAYLFFRASKHVRRLRQVGRWSMKLGVPALAAKLPVSDRRATR